MLHDNDNGGGKNWIIYLITVTNQIKKQLKHIGALETLPEQEEEVEFVQKIMHHLLMLTKPLREQ